MPRRARRASCSTSYVLIAVGSNGIPLAHEPFAHVFVFVQDRAKDAAVFVGALDLNLHVLAAISPESAGTLHPQALFVPDSRVRVGPT